MTNAVLMVMEIAAPIFSCALWYVIGRLDGWGSCKRKLADPAECRRAAAESIMNSVNNVRNVERVTMLFQQARIEKLERQMSHTQDMAGKN